MTTLKAQLVLEHCEALWILDHQWQVGGVNGQRMPGLEAVAACAASLPDETGECISRVESLAMGFVPPGIAPATPECEAKLLELWTAFDAQATADWNAKNAAKAEGSTT